MDLLILELAQTGRAANDAEIQAIRTRVAAAGFDPSALETVRGRLAGFIWQGRTLRGRDRLPSAEVHYVWHVAKRGEWPPGTTLQQYLVGARDVVLDPASGIFLSRFANAWQVGFVRRSGPLRGPRGGEWVLVEYRVDTGHWVTAYQPERGLQQLENPGRSEVRWLHEPPQQ